MSVVYAQPKSPVSKHQLFTREDLLWLLYSSFAGQHKSQCLAISLYIISVFSNKPCPLAGDKA